MFQLQQPFAVLAFKGIRYLLFAYDKSLSYSYLQKTLDAPHAQKQLTEGNFN